MLEKVVLKLPELKLICIDTFSEHMRGNEMGFGDRKRMVSDLLMGLGRIANKFGICVVVVNNMRPGKREHIPQEIAGD
jgi:RecA/RadA recombinase